MLGTVKLPAATLTRFAGPHVLYERRSRCGRQVPTREISHQVANAEHALSILLGVDVAGQARKEGAPTGLPLRATPALDCVIGGDCAGTGGCRCAFRGRRLAAGDARSVEWARQMTGTTRPGPIAHRLPLPGASASAPIVGEDGRARLIRSRPACFFRLALRSRPTTRSFEARRDA